MGLIGDAQLQRTLADALRGCTAEEQVQILERLCEQDCAAAFSTDVEAASCAGSAVRPGLFAFEASPEPAPYEVLRPLSAQEFYRIFTLFLPVAQKHACDLSPDWRSLVHVHV